MNKKLTELPKGYESWRQFYESVKHNFKNELPVMFQEYDFSQNHWKYCETFEITELELLRFVANEKQPELLTDNEFFKIRDCIYWSAGSKDVSAIVNKLEQLTDGLRKR